MVEHDPGRDQPPMAAAADLVNGAFRELVFQGDADNNGRDPSLRPKRRLCVPVIGGTACQGCELCLDDYKGPPPVELV